MAHPDVHATVDTTTSRIGKGRALVDTESVVEALVERWQDIGLRSS
jgi:hypothetical protein